MTDLYTKVVLTVIAAALCVSIFQNMNLVNPAFAAGNQVHKIAICEDDGSRCASIYKGGYLKIGN